MVAPAWKAPTTTIPTVVAEGAPEPGYPWPWSIYRWIQGGDIVDSSSITAKDKIGLARSVAEFVTELHAVDSANGPLSGSHNFYRGGSLNFYDADTRRYMTRYKERWCAATVMSIWDRALSSRWESAPVWVHGDLEHNNLLVRNSELAAVIDFGGCAVGDPACDLVMAWTFFDKPSRDVFQAELVLDIDTWNRARGWALWKALFRLHSCSDQQTEVFSVASNIIDIIVESASGIP